MFVLKHATGEIYNLSLQSEHLIGRLGNLELLNDSSVSRHHACIKVSVKNGKFRVVLEDLGSKYGTYINEGIEQSKEVPKKTAINLEVGDVIRFGQQWNTWRLVKESFVIAASTLTTQEKSFMNKIASKLNGIIVLDWNKNCTHLTMNRMKITIKVACALGHVKPIVTINYWKHLLAALESKEETVLPDYVNFIPRLEEPLLDANHFDFKMKSARRTLFENVKFIAFGSAQVNLVLPMIEAAGGTVIDGKIFKLSEEQLLNEKIIIIQPKNNEITVAKAYQDILSTHRLRTVPELEIGLSIASCSLDLYCNPAYDVSILFKQPATQIIKDDATILAIGTQDVEEDDTEYQEDPCGSNFSLTVNDKNQEFSDSEDELNDTDRSVIEDSAELVSSSRFSKLSMKRKSEERNEEPAKNSRLDAYLTRSKRTTSSSCNNSESLLSGPTVSKKPIRDLFSFDIDNRKINKNSSSLFEGIHEHVKETCKNISEKRNSSEQSTCSFVFDSQRRGTEESSTSITTPKNVQQTKRSTKNLFDGLNVSEKESPVLFSNDSDRKVDLNVIIKDKPERNNKRKFVDSFDIPTSKIANKRTKSLFELSSSKNKKTEATPVVNSEDDPDSVLEHGTKKLNISKEVTKTTPSMPIVNVPTTVSLSQFVDVSVNKVHIKTEPLDLPTQVRDILNTTVVHIAPLTKNSPKSVKENKCFEVNFKKFRKGQYRKSSMIIPPSALRVYIPELEDGYNED